MPSLAGMRQFFIGTPRRQFVTGVTSAFLSGGGVGAGVMHAVESAGSTAVRHDAGVVARQATPTPTVIPSSAAPAPLPSAVSIPRYDDRSLWVDCTAFLNGNGQTVEAFRNSGAPKKLSDGLPADAQIDSIYATAIVDAGKLAKAPEQANTEAFEACAGKIPGAKVITDEPVRYPDFADVEGLKSASGEVKPAYIEKAGDKDASRDANYFYHSSVANTSTSGPLRCESNAYTTLDKSEPAAKLLPGFADQLPPGGALGPTGSIQTVSVRASKPGTLTVNADKASPADALAGCGYSGRTAKPSSAGKDIWDATDPATGKSLSVFKHTSDDGKKVSWTVTA